MVPEHRAPLRAKSQESIAFSYEILPGKVILKPLHWYAINNKMKAKGEVKIQHILRRTELNTSIEFECEKDE